MTISSTTNRVEYNGDGATVAFPFPYYFPLSADLKVYVDGTLKTETTDYSVTGAGVSSGGTVTMVTAPATGTANVVIVRDPSPVQSVDWLDGGADDAEVQETAFDKAMIIAQRHAELFTRSMRIPDYDTATDMTLPAIATRASKYLAFDAAGAPIASSGGIDPAIPVSAFGETLVDDADAATARTTLGIVDYSRNVMSTSLATAGQYSDLASIDLGSAASDFTARLLLTCGQGTSLCAVDLLVVCKQTTAISTTESKIQVLSISDNTNVKYNDFFLAASATTLGTVIHLWMKSETAVLWKVQELALQTNSNATTPISYNDASTWTATDPLAGPPAVAITSIWPNTGTWSLTVTSGSGTITTASGSGNYTKIGNVVFWRAVINITTNGTGDGYVIFDLPFTPSAYSNGTGRDSGISGFNLDVQITYASIYAQVRNYDGTYPGADGSVLRVSGIMFV